jgi:hypothetical protein
VNPLRFTVIGDLAWLWLLILAAGLAALAVLSVRAAAKRRGVRLWLLVAGAMGSALGALGALAGVGGIGLFALLGGSGPQRVIAVSPDQRFHLVLHEAASGIDPVQGLYIQTTGGPFSQRTYLGCVNGDADGKLLASGRFTGADTVRVRAENGRQWTLRFNPDTVRAIDTLPPAICGKDLYTG